VALDTLPPAYPEQAKADSLHGVVDVEAMILRDGSVQVRRTAAESGLTILERAAADQVAQWRFQAGTLNGDAIEVPLRVSLSFELGPRPGGVNDF
jgi:protein TonB